MPKQKEMVCKHCGKTFTMLLKEYNRQTKRGRSNFYCSLNCSGADSKALKIMMSLPQHPKVLERQRRGMKWGDEFSDYKEYIRKAKRRQKKFGFDVDIDVKYLKELFESQNGKCAVTGVELIHGSNINKNFMASVDRIDSSLGYIRGNVRFVSLTVNYAKNDQTEECLQEFIDIIRGTK